MSYHPALRAGLVIVAIACAPALAVAQTTGAADALPTGQTPVGATYVAETHGDWEIRCIRAEEGQPEPCQLYQLMRDSQGGAVAEFNVFDIPDEGQLVAGATIVTPLETLLTPGIRLRVDEGNWSEYPFAFCQPIGCFARLGLTEEDLTALRRGGARRWPWCRYPHLTSSCRSRPRSAALPQASQRLRRAMTPR